MKKLWIPIFILFFFSTAGAGIFVEWNSNVEADLAGYKLYAGSGSEALKPVGSAAKDSGRWEIPDSLNLLSHFAVTAFNFSGDESGFSSIISRDIFAVSYEKNTLEFYVPENGSASVYINGKLFADILGAPGDTVLVRLPRVMAYGGECVVELSTGAAYAFELFVTGDADHDGIIGVFDQAAFDVAFGTTTQSTRYNPEFDFDADGDVDVWDQVEFDSLFGMAKNE